MSESSFEHGRPYAYGRKMVCPACSQYEGTPGLCSSPAKITEPVYLLVKINGTTNQKFLGCPNFPKCKHSADVYSVRRAKQEARVWNIDYDDELRPY